MNSDKDDEYLSIRGWYIWKDDKQDGYFYWKADLITEYTGSEAFAVQQALDALEQNS